jgi:cytosine/adenosine deaminase-related metal-dependent hydrolase
VTDRTLIKDAIVLTQDPELGELPQADILVEDDRIADTVRRKLEEAR